MSVTPPQLLLGPLLRHVGERDATVWVETDRPCDVEVLGCSAPTFTASGHHFALVIVEGLEPGTTNPYSVTLDGHVVWPEAGNAATESTHPHAGPRHPLRIAFGSCRVAAPHAAPWSLTKDEHEEGREIDALLALGVRMRASDPADWPDLLVLLGDQVYADQVSPATKRYIESRTADRNGAPLSDVADFEEYCHLYWEAWRTPLMRWLLSTVPTTMIFDDHDVHDDWNTSDVVGPRDPQAALVARADHRRLRVLLDLPAHREPLARRSPRRRALPAGRRGRGRDRDPARVRRPRRARAEREPLELPARHGPHAALVVDSRAGRVLEPGTATCSTRPSGSGWTTSSPATSTTCSSGRRCRSCWRPACTISRRGTRRSPAASGAGWRRASPSPCARGSTSSTGRRSSARFRRLPGSSPRWPAAGAGARRPRSSCSPATCTTRTSPRRRSPTRTCRASSPS